MRLLAWIARALVFFSLFAFALNNQQMADVRWFFGFESRAPMVFIVLVAFALGCALGVFAMVPSWWKHRQVAKRQRSAGAPPSTNAVSPSGDSPLPALTHPPRDGL
jgi:lipopolysaccharide assembly protein A